ncbi:MAG: hypothetical protein ABIS45_08195 [Burkholderiales bacterium]
MSKRKPKCNGRQCGNVAIFMIAVLVVVGASWFGTSLGTNMVFSERERKTASALAQAKQALIGRATIDSSLPGSLPCPDLVTNIAGNNVPNDGIADLFAGHNCPSYLGRLPWRTLGLADLRDADGEHLWYALSPNFRDYASVVLINDSTSGTLSIAGNAPLTNVVAVIFSPGAALGTQSRSGVANQSNVTNYLEGANATGGAAFSVQTASADFNDRLMTITVADLMAIVEKRVANEITIGLNRYFVANSVLPNAALPADFSCQPHGDPNLCLPSASTATGLLPRNLTPGAGWPGSAFPGWFNANWRTSMTYAVAPECTSLPACSSTTFSAVIDAGIFTPKVTLIVGAVMPFTARIIAR